MTRSACIVGALFVALAPLGTAARDSLVVLSSTGRIEVPLVHRGGMDLVPLRVLAERLHLPARAAGADLTLGAPERELKVTAGKTVATLQGAMRLLPAPCVLESGDWWVDMGAAATLLGDLLRKPVRLRAAQKAFLLPGAVVPGVKVTGIVSANAVRVVLTPTSPVPFRVSQEPGRVVVRLEADVVDVETEDAQPAGGIVKSIVFSEKVQPPEVAIATGPLFREFRGSDADASGRLILDFLGGERTAETAGPANVGVGPSTPGLRTVVIDPGHGGADAGVSGPRINEKDLALRVAQRLQAALVSSWGINTFLTREADSALEVDARSGIANSFHAELFVSLHANACKKGGWPGPQAFSLPNDGDPAPLVAGQGSLTSWTAAHTTHAATSARLASEIQARLVAGLGRGRPDARTARLRVLVGATMPAVLVDLGCIDDAKEAGAIVGEEGERRVVDAIAAALARYAPSAVTQ